MNLGIVLTEGINEKIYFQIFKNSFSGSLSTINFNILPNHRDIYSFKRKLDKSFYRNKTACLGLYFYALVGRFF